MILRSTSDPTNIIYDLPIKSITNFKNIANLLNESHNFEVILSDNELINLSNNFDNCNLSYKIILNNNLIAEMNANPLNCSGAGYPPNECAITLPPPPIPIEINQNNIYQNNLICEKNGIVTNIFNVEQPIQPKTILTNISTPIVNQSTGLAKNVIDNYWPFFLIAIIIVALMYKFQNLLKIFTGKNNDPYGYKKDLEIAKKRNRSVRKWYKNAMKPYRRPKYGFESYKKK